MLLDLAEKLREFNAQHDKLYEAGVNSRVLIVDAMNTYIRCFCATPSMNDDGEHVGGITGFLKSIGASIRQFSPTRVVCVFDGRGGSQRRRKLYDGYKDKRRSMERLNRTYDFRTVEEEREAIKWQLHLLVKILDHLPVTTFSVENIEADDTIAYLAQLVTERGGHSIILSTDRDFLQLIGDSCTVYNPIKKKLYTTMEVIEEYHIHPKNFLLYRIIEGDKSDNIPGVKGVGKASLVKNFPALAEAAPVSIDNLLCSCKEPKNAACRKIAEAHEAGLLERNIELMRLDEIHIAGTTKLQILDSFDRPIVPLNKYGLTKILGEYKLFSAFGNYDEWILTTWIPLQRFHREAS